MKSWRSLNFVISAISFDGQWHNIAVKDKDGSPLTLLQLQKDVWKSVEAMAKKTILTEIRSLNSVVYWFFENVQESQDETRKVITCTNNNERLPKISPR